MQGIVKNTFFEIAAPMKSMHRRHTTDLVFNNDCDSSKSDCDNISISSTNTDLVYSTSDIEESAFTTVSVRNIPARYGQKQFLDDVQALGFEIDFLFVPRGNKGRKNRSYGFVNFLTASDAKKFMEAFHGFCFANQDTKHAVCQFARLQGYEANVHAYKTDGQDRNAANAPWIKSEN